MHIWICTKCICTCIMCKCTYTYIYIVRVRYNHIYIYTSLEHIPPSNLLLKKTHGTGVGRSLIPAPQPSAAFPGLEVYWGAMCMHWKRHPQDATVTPRMQPLPIVTPRMQPSPPGCNRYQSLPPGCNRYQSLPPGCNRYHPDDILTYFSGIPVFQNLHGMLRICSILGGIYRSKVSNVYNPLSCQKDDVSNVKQTLGWHSIESWLVNRDPYNGLF